MLLLLSILQRLSFLSMINVSLPGITMMINDIGLKLAQLDILPEPVMSTFNLNSQPQKRSNNSDDAQRYVGVYKSRFCLENFKSSVIFIFIILCTISLMFLLWIASTCFTP
jgi:hypothetical protein